MENKFVIACRYEHWSREGKCFTNWFYINTQGLTKTDAAAIVKKNKADSNDIDKCTKLKHEYKVVPYTEYEKLINQIHENALETKRKYEEYKKSDAYKEIQKRKREERKALTERQKKYIKEHTLNEA